MEQEIWKGIEGLETLCEISNYGNARSLDRVTNAITGRIHKGKLLKKTIREDKRVYYEIKRKSYSASRLVAMAFVPNPDNLPIVEHKDDDSTNNFYQNLLWSNQSNNSINRHYRSDKSQIVPVLQYSKRGNVFIQEFESVRSAARSVSGVPIHISNACKSDSKTAYGFKWKYKP